ADMMRQKAERSISFGRATWPHMLFRAMLAEQLYRASAILAGHPYHRGD
ncbi:23S rRNA (pseudouridine(1915)-N(3))-methyltransferase RlmH, partial [Alphaproteobacteria bacterium]|nr:23S rRNA (pseudouridine(1915)-N(3))-methyltransferase RlmH [Alphaproteobacteria bacterium]